SDIVDMEIADSTIEQMFNVNFQDVMNDALTGAGNDVGNAINQIANTSDDDVLENAEVSNNDAFSQTFDVSGGFAKAEEGINAGGSGGSGGSGADASGGSAFNLGLATGGNGNGGDGTGGDADSNADGGLGGGGDATAGNGG